MTVTYRAAGLDRPVEILVDRWGIPHIYAEHTDDLFFAQGFNAARDRLFQLDLWRRRGLGRLAEAFGPSYVGVDRAARLLHYRGDIEAEWDAYGPRTRRIIERFTAGVNAYLLWLDEHPEALPPEFELLDFRPARWSPEDVVRPRVGAPTFNLLFEFSRSKVAAGAGSVAADAVRQRLEPDHVSEMPAGLDPDLPPDVLRDYLLGVQPFGRLAGAGKASAGEGSAGKASAGEGSNNWAIAADRSATGRPMLASDPHRAFAAPSLRYIAHLSAPGLDVIGAGEPAVPGIALGHNGTAAFGFTIFPIDTEDLYVCDADAEPSWSEVETIEVRGEAPRVVELEFTRHGPVLYVDATKRRLYTLRTTWSEPGTAPYLGALDLIGAESWPDFEAGLRRWRHPGENHVYADTSGTIAWQAAGLAPRRTGGDGLLPVPIDRRAARSGQSGWDGYHGLEDFPGVVDPPEGFIATANQFNIPAGKPALAYEWPDDTRYRRIVEVLSATERCTIADMVALQNDQLSLTARELLPVLAEVECDDPMGKAALGLLLSWDAVVAADSAAAALYEVWFTRHLSPAFVSRSVPPVAAQWIDQPDARVVRDAILDPSDRKSRDILVVTTLRAAYAELEHLLGGDPEAWQWGALHQTFQPHPFGHLAPDLDVGPAPIGGAANTVNAAAYWPEDFSPSIGASFRMVVDVGGWDNSLCINTPGQSGDPRSPHYRDLFETWRAGEYIPMLYSRAAVLRHTEQRIRLEPDLDA